MQYVSLERMVLRCSVVVPFRNIYLFHGPNYGPRTSYTCLPTAGREKKRKIRRIMIDIEEVKQGNSIDLFFFKERLKAEEKKFYYSLLKNALVFACVQLQNCIFTSAPFFV